MYLGKRFWGIFKNIEEIFKKIPGKFEEDFRECSRRFQEILAKILGNVNEHSGYSSRRFQGMLV